MNSPEGGVRVVEDLDAEVRRRQNQQNGIQEAADGDAKAEVVTGLAAALGREIYTWTSPYNSAVVVRFRRPRAGTDELVSRLLDDKADNANLVRRYKALLSVVEIDGKDVVTTRMTDTKLRILRDRIGFVGPDEDDTFDDPINMFVTAYELAMYPEQIKAINEAQGIGLSSEDIARIAKNTGLERPKA